jgi:hypothetical protein
MGFWGSGSEREGWAVGFGLRFVVSPCLKIQRWGTRHRRGTTGLNGVFEEYSFPTDAFMSLQGIATLIVFWNLPGF